MTTPERPAPPVGPGRRRLAVLAVASTAAAGALSGTAPPAAAAPATIDDATLTWGINVELQSAPPFGGCSYLSAGESDGTQASYQTTDGHVTVLKNGTAPSWGNKCDGAPQRAVDQQVVWSGGTGTADPDTGEVSLAFEGRLSVNFYGGLVPFTIEDPVVTVDSGGDGQLVATLFGYGSSMEDPTVKVPLEPVEGVVVADLSGVASDNPNGFTVVPDYAGVQYEPPAGSGGTPQNRTVDGWGSWPASWVDFHYETGLTSYWYSSGGGADPLKPATALSISYTGGGDPDPGPGDDQQRISVTVPENTEPGEFLWSIDGDRAADLGEATNEGTSLRATGALDPIAVTDARTGGPQWSISGQVSDFTGGLPGSYLGWTPTVLTAGAGAVAGGVVAPGITGGNGLADSSILAAAPAGHEPGTSSIGADLDLRLPVETAPGTYTAILTITALS